MAKLHDGENAILCVRLCLPLQARQGRGGPGGGDRLPWASWTTRKLTPFTGWGKPLWSSRRLQRHRLLLLTALSPARRRRLALYDAAGQAMGAQLVPLHTKTEGLTPATRLRPAGRDTWTGRPGLLTGRAGGHWRSRYPRRRPAGPELPLRQRVLPFNQGLAPVLAGHRKPPKLGSHLSPGFIDQTGYGPSCRLHHCFVSGSDAAWRYLVRPLARSRTKRDTTEPSTRRPTALPFQYQKLWPYSEGLAPSGRAGSTAICTHPGQRPSPPGTSGPPASRRYAAGYEGSGPSTSTGGAGR